MGSLAWKLGKKSCWGDVSIRGGLKHRSDKTRLPTSYWQQCCCKREAASGAPCGPLYPHAPFGSEPRFPQCHPAYCKSSSPCFCLCLAFCCFGLPACAAASVLPSSLEENSRDPENSPALLWSGPPRWIRQPRGLVVVQSASAAGERDGEGRLSFH